jgi:hypothetical protein
LRGLFREEVGAAAAERILDRRLRLKVDESRTSRQWMWEGYIEAPITGTYTFCLKVNGEYKIRLGDTVLFENRKHVPQHLQNKKIDLQKGVYPITMRYQTYPESDGIFYLYWTLPGGGIFIQPIAGEYLYPAFPGRFEKLSDAVYRYYWLLLLFVVFPPALFYHAIRQKSVVSQSDKPSFDQPGE